MWRVTTWSSMCCGLPCPSRTAYPILRREGFPRKIGGEFGLMPSRSHGDLHLQPSACGRGCYAPLSGRDQLHTDRRRCVWAKVCFCIGAPRVEFVAIGERVVLADTAAWRTLPPGCPEAIDWCSQAGQGERPRRALSCARRLELMTSSHLSDRRRLYSRLVRRGGSSC